MLLPFLQEISPFFLKWKMNFLSHRFLGARVDRFLEVRLVASWDGSYGMATGSGFCSSTRQDQTGTPAINQVPRCWLQRCLTYFLRTLQKWSNLTKCFLFGFNAWFNHLLICFLVVWIIRQPDIILWSVAISACEKGEKWRCFVPKNGTSDYGEKDRFRTEINGRQHGKFAEKNLTSHYWGLWLFSFIILFSNFERPSLSGGFKCFLFSLLIGEDSHFDTYFSKGLKPPARKGMLDLWVLIWHPELFQRIYMKRLACFFCSAWLEKTKEEFPRVPWFHGFLFEKVDVVTEIFVQIIAWWHVKHGLFHGKCTGRLGPLILVKIVWPWWLSIK